MAYTEMVMIIRKLYQDCRLVHGDLSEYNILFHEVCNRRTVLDACLVDQCAFACSPLQSQDVRLFA